MSEHSSEQDAAREAAQNVADEVSSYQQGAESDTAREQLDEGLEKAGVDVPEEERQSLARDARDPDDRPRVEDAKPAE